MLGSLALTASTRNGFPEGRAARRREESLFDRARLQRGLALFDVDAELDAPYPMAKDDGIPMLLQGALELVEAEPVEGFAAPLLGCRELLVHVQPLHVLSVIRRRGRSCDARGLRRRALGRRVTHLAAIRRQLHRWLSPWRRRRRRPGR